MISAEYGFHNENDYSVGWWGDERWETVVYGSAADI